MKNALGAAALWLATAFGVAAQPSSSEYEPKAYEVPSGDIFGFTTPTDVGSPGDKDITLETTTRLGKRGGTYWSPTLKTQMGGTIANNVWLGLSPFVTGHRIRSVPDLDDRSQLRFDGFSGEVIYRFLERTQTNPLAAAFSIEPRVARVGPVTGEPVSAYAAEFKLLLDAVLVPDRLYAAINLNYALGTERHRWAVDAKWEEASATNVSGALAYQAAERVLVGVEARYLTVFSGAFMNEFAGHAVFAGPNLFLKLSDSAALNFAWTPQLAGRAKGIPASLDLNNFERHQFRLKFAASF
jgi:hypothetical protein